MQFQYFFSIPDVLRLIQMAETRISQAISLQTKFLWNFEKVENQAEADDKEAVKQQMQNFVKELFVKPEVSVIGAARGPAGIFFIVLNLFTPVKSKLSNLKN